MTPEIQAALTAALEHHRAGRLAEARAIYQQVLDQDAESPDALFLLGVAEFQADNIERATDLTLHALRLRPDVAEFHIGLGNIRHKQWRLKEAIDCYRTATTLHPGHAEAWMLLAQSLRFLGQFDEALSVSERAISIRPNLAGAHMQRAIALFQLRRWPEGFAEYEWRRQLREYGFPSPRHGARPAWDGVSDIRGKHLLIYGEQGYGDAIQFIRYVPELAARTGARITVETLPALCPLLQLGSVVSDIVSSDTDTIIDYDLNLPMLSLTHVLKTSPDLAAPAAPYIRSDPGRVQAWTPRLGASKAFRVGLVWAGSAGHHNDRNRSMSLAALALLTSIPGAEFHSLQVGPTAEHIRQNPSLGIHDHSSHLTDFAETAALIEMLDLVIAVDTSPAHLAGAMGKPVWLLVPTPGDWRWAHDQDGSVWYPSMRVFRQSTPGNWSGVVGRVAERLKSLANNPQRSV